jgi:putative sterol carrier protein
MARTAQEVFQIYTTHKDEPILRSVQGSYLFDIENVGTWFVSVDKGALTFDEQRHEADCVISCSEQDFVDIVEGRRNLITAALQGRVQIRGNVALAQKFHGLLGTIGQKRGAA